MAYQRFTTPTSVAQQVRTTALGVNGGGSSGRMRQAHKGFGLNQNKGGLNARGSARSPFAAGVVPVPRAASAPKPASSDPAAPAAPVTPVPAVNPKPTDPLPWESMSAYISAMASAQREAGNQRATLQRQLSDNAAAYGRGLSDGKRSFEKGIGDNADALSRQGLLRSGSREVSEADAVRQFDRYMEDLNTQHGPRAAARINEELSRIDEWFIQQKLAAEQAAREQYPLLNPAAPIAPKPKPQQAQVDRLKQSGYDSAIFKGGFLQSWDAKKKKNVYRSLDKLTREEILRLLARPINQRMLADGWRFANGRIVKG